MAKNKICTLEIFVTFFLFLFVFDDFFFSNPIQHVWGNKMFILKILTFSPLVNIILAKRLTYGMELFGSHN